MFTLSIVKKVKAGRPKSEQKRQKILFSASQLFLCEGLTNTSMDSVAKASGVSKQTVYSHFSSKEELFQAAISHKCQSYQLDPTRLSHTQACALPFERCLQEVGMQFMRLLQDPEVISMYRVVMSEAKNNPQIAELFYEAGPAISLHGMADLFMHYHPELSSNHALALAHDFFSLLKGDVHMQLLCGLVTPLEDAALITHVEQVVSKLLILFDAYYQT